MDLFGSLAMDWAGWSNKSDGKTSSQPSQMHQDSVVFPTAPCIPVPAEYMVGKAPETLLNEEKWEILIPTVSTALMESPSPLCCWVIMNICLKKKKRKKKSAGLFTKILSIFLWDIYFQQWKFRFSGFQVRQPITSVRSAYGQKSNVELPCFLVEQDFTPDFQCC